MTRTLTSAGLTALASRLGGYALTWATNWLLAIRFAVDRMKTQATIAKQILLRLYGWEPDFSRANFSVFYRRSP